MEIKELLNSIQTGLIDNKIISLEDDQPSLILNKKHISKVSNYLRNELLRCDEFYFSVAFITEGGLALLVHTLKILAEKGVKGKMITSDYLCFNEPKVFEKLLKIPNLEVRVNTDENFHIKGYIFKQADKYSLIIGSSNLTQRALTENQEWNLRLTSTYNGQLIIDSLAEFEQAWEKATVLTNDWIHDYEAKYINIIRYEEQLKIRPEQAIKPNLMQQEAISNLKQLREKGKDKALLISATGTGKTYLSAFDVQQARPKKVLFLAHRERLLKDAAKSFQKILGSEIKIGYYLGNEKSLDCDYLFASIMTINKEEHLKKFKKDTFDYLIIDEVHHALANTYQNIIAYFKPKFILGMTATPERTDGLNVFELFDYNIAYEIRLQKALEEKMLCPFHYYGLTELRINGEVISDQSDFSKLVSEARVDHIIEKAKYYGHCANRLKGLIFCSQNEEARKLAHLFNQKGYRTLALSSTNSDKEREEAIKRLEQDEDDNALDYLITVDIFNEGVDIPSVNQIIMLRKTKSVIVFLQQLGRGLRKSINKKYLTVLDFVGNYDNNYLIPIALSGDNTYNKDNLRKFMNNANTIVPNSSSIEFDEVVKEKIYKAINNARFEEYKFLKQEYLKLKNKLGKIPSHQDFVYYEAIDLQNIINYSNSYLNFLLKVEPKLNIDLDKSELKMIEFISKEISNGKRSEEIMIILGLLDKEEIEISQLSSYLLDEFELKFSDQALNSALNLLKGGFLRAKEWEKYDMQNILAINSNIISLAINFKKALAKPLFKKIVLDLLLYAKHNYLAKYSDHYLGTNFKLYEKYSRKDVCRLLNWDKNIVALNIGGYKYDEKTNTMAVFVTYEKDEDISDSLKYEDRFINKQTIVCVSKANRNLNSPEIVRIYDKENRIQIHLFLNRLKEEKEFYYLGEIRAIGDPILVKRSNQDTVVDITYQLKTSVREDIFDFITK